MVARSKKHFGQQIQALHKSACDDNLFGLNDKSLELS